MNTLGTSQNGSPSARSWIVVVLLLAASGGTPYAIPAGASDHPLGGLGFANWAHEVAAQEAQLGVFFDTIVVCSVTGSTHAGMIAGFADLQQNFGGRERRVRLGCQHGTHPACWCAGLSGAARRAHGGCAVQCKNIG